MCLHDHMHSFIQFALPVCLKLIWSICELSSELQVLLKQCCQPVSFFQLPDVMQDGLVMCIVLTVYDNRLQMGHTQRLRPHASWKQDSPPLS